jgi:dolichol-phosphate mannosyltransferase
MSISRLGPKELMTALDKLSVIIPAHNEAENLATCVTRIEKILGENKIDREIIVVNDNSTDDTTQVLENLCQQFKCLKVVENKDECGFGRAVRLGLQEFSGEAVAIMMADLSDSPYDLVRYWSKLKEGYECVFGSRFISGGKTIDYPKAKLVVNRIVNTAIRYAFKIPCNDITNAFKIYRREVIEGSKPFISPHFNLTVEIPLKAIIRGFSWTTIPISWRNRSKGVAKLKLREMGSRYFFIIAYLWLEKYFSRGDYFRNK